MRTKFIWILLLVLIIITAAFTGRGRAEMGGEVKTIIGSTYFRDKDEQTAFKEILNLNYYFPRYQRYKPEFEVDLTYTVSNINELKNWGRGDCSHLVKKLYIKRSGEKLNLSLGRQPISWPFGSLLNPVDYNLGAEALEEATAGKYVDALEGYFPINWNSGLTAVISRSRKNDEIKYGMRGRWGIKNYDITLNLVKEERMRAGVTFKGDLRGVGFYGAVGHYKTNEGDKNSFLIGTDYSYSFNYGMNQLGIQFEYLRINPENFYNLVGIYKIEEVEAANDYFDLLIGNINYQIDEFTSISLSTINSFDRGSMLLNPGYKTHLKANWDLEIQLTLFMDYQEQRFMPKAAGEISLSYPF